MTMGRDERINAATIQLRQSRDAFVRRLCESNTHTLDAVAVTMIVTMPEPGATPGTCSTVGHTAWGARLEQQPLDHQDELCRQHIAAAKKRLADAVKNGTRVKLIQTEGAARLKTKTVEEMARGKAAARANAAAADKGKLTKST